MFMDSSNDPLLSPLSQAENLCEFYPTRASYYLYIPPVLGVLKGKCAKYVSVVDPVTHF